MSAPDETLEENTLSGLMGVVLDGRFRLDAPIGNGAMGTVFAATQLSVDRPVAVKLIRGAHDATTVARFRREARALSRIAQDSVVRLIDLGVDSEQGPFIVMELLSGRPITQLEPGAPPQALFRLAEQLLQGLAAIHEAGVVHRDIKPSNLLLVPTSTGSERLVIVDFGISRPHAEPSVTATGTVVGSPRYMSPEQANGSPPTPSMDLYAAGAVLYELAAGHPIFPDAEASAEVIVAHATRRPRALRLSGTEGRALTTLVQALLQKSPMARPASAAAALELLQGSGAARRRAGSMAWVAAAVAAGVIAGAVLLTGTSTPAAETAPTVRSLRPAATPPSAPRIIPARVPAPPPPTALTTAAPTIEPPPVRARTRKHRRKPKKPTTSDYKYVTQ